MSRARISIAALTLGLLSAAAFLGACQSEEPQVGSQTNWLEACTTSSECGKLECICGTCTQTCTSSDACGELAASSCVEASEDGAIALCGGTEPSESLCLLRCDDAPCPDGSHCVAGVCSPARTPTLTVSIDPEATRQQLVGIGASIAYDGDFIIGHPEKEAMYDALFTDAGLDMIRVRSRWDGANPDNLAAASEIVAAAEGRLGAPPVVLLTSASPPPALKQNGARFCDQADPACTLARNVDGDFDYAAFGDYWSGALQAYEAAGVVADYISIQNNPDWLPAFPEGGEACRFLPEEGTIPVELTDGTTVDADFPGYDAALNAVRAAVAPLGRTYGFVAPETERIQTFAPFTDALAPETFDAIAYHMFAVDPLAPPIDELEALNESGVPHMQTEMTADGLGTAILIHHTFVTGGGVAYIQQQLVAQSLDAEGGAPIGTDADTFEVQPALHALAHFARHTQTGWSVVEVSNETPDVLTSAWLSPDETALTIVIVNRGSDPADVELAVPADWEDALVDSTVTRSVFDGLELSADLGVLPGDRVTRVPARSIVTVSAVR